MTKSEIKCESCKRIDKMRNRGEYAMPPKGWVLIIDAETYADISHFCGPCYAQAISRHKTKAEEKVA